MIIPQPDRILLQLQTGTYSHMLSGDILDIGCGKARRYGSFPEARSYKTLDIDPLNQPDIIASAEAIPLPDGSIDGVICTQVLEHVEHPWIAMKEIARVLRTGGRCLITVPQANELHEEPHDYYRFTKYALESLCRDNNLEIEALDQRGRQFTTQTQMQIRGFINRWLPYEHKSAMLVLWPITTLLTFVAFQRDRIQTHASYSRHAIGWCIVARKT